MSVNNQLSKQDITRFKVWLARNNTTQAEFARRCGVSRQYLCQILKGKRHVTKKVAEMFKNSGYTIRSYSSLVKEADEIVECVEALEGGTE